MFDFLFQIGADSIHRTFNEMRKAAQPILPSSIGSGTAIQLAPGITVEPVLTISEELVFPVTLNEESQSVEIQLSGLGAQFLVAGNNPMGDVLFESDVSYLLSLPLSVNEDGRRVAAGFNPAQFGNETALVSLADGHPLADDAVLEDILTRLIQALFLADGFSPIVEERDIPLPNGWRADLSIYFNDSIRMPTALTVRVEDSPLGDAFRQLRVPFEYQLTIRTEEGSEISTFSALEEFVADIPVSRDLDPGGPNGQLDVRLTEGERAMEFEEGDDLRGNPNWPLFEATLLDRFDQELAEFGPQEYGVPSLELILGTLRQMMIDGLSANRDDDGVPDFIPIWQSTRPDVDTEDEEISAQAAIIGQTITIGMNGAAGDTLDGVAPFIPENRDFAVRLAPEPLLEEVETFLATRASYDDAAGGLSVAEDAPAGANQITLRGFEAETGTFRSETRIRIEGIFYIVAADASISRLPDEEPPEDDEDAEEDDAPEGNDRNQCTVTLTTDLAAAVERGQFVAVIFGFGLPRRISGSPADLRINADFSPSFQDGHMRLSGTGRVITDSHLVPDFNVSLGINLGLRYLSTARVRGDDQSGDALVVEVLDLVGDEPLVTGFPEGSLIRIDDDRALYELTADAGNGESETLSLSRDLDTPHEHNDMVSLLWTPIGEVVGDAQEDQTLRIGNMTHDEDRIPAGVTVTVSGKGFTLAQAATIDDDQVVTLTLTERLDSHLSEPPPQNALVFFSSGWSGSGTVNPGAQRSEELILTNVVRRLPRGAELRIGGKNGVFRVREPEAAVVEDREVTVTLSHPATDDIARSYPDLVTPGLLWEVHQQPQAGATVWRRTGAPRRDLHRIGDAQVQPDGPFDDLVGFLVGLFTAALLTGTPYQLLAGLIAGVLTRRLVGRLVQSAGAERDISLDITLPVDDDLTGFGVHLDVTANNPIEISPDGLLIAGQLNPRSSYPEVLESRVRTDGPFDFEAAAPGQLTANAPVPSNVYSWRTGDGATLTEPAPSHTYLRAGTYIASLSGTDTQLVVPRRSRHFAEVRVANRPPVLAALPELSGFEGQEIVLTANYTDAAYADAHRAIVIWGDGHLPEIVEVDEELGPPQTRGRITARHRYCDNGVFTVTVVVEDEQGGTDRRETRAVIENLPPEVEAGPDVFAHPCVPTRLVGRFTDPGWCDTHSAVWDFGDCTPPFPATIEETHAAPEGRGTATATHCYTGCGTWQARLTVTDDDGASATDTLIVTHSSLRNSAFEEGFAQTRDGKVARHWQGYATPQSSIVPPGAVFDCESCVTFDGGTSQSVRAEGYDHAGLRQSFGTNIGWEYQVSARLTVRGQGATGWIGLDPLGGTDRAAPSIVWRSLAQAEGWQAVSCRAVAEARQVTVLVEFRTPQARQLLIDAVDMKAYPCVPSDSPEAPQEPEPRRTCIDLHNLTQTNPPGAAVQDLDGFILSYASGQPLDLVTLGPPVGASKVRVPARSASDHLNVELPAPTGFAEALVWAMPSDRIEMRAYGADDLLLAETSSDIGDLQTLVIQQDGIERLEISSGQRGALHMVCSGTADSPADECGCKKRPPRASDDSLP
jgi:hypothetical protein